MLAIGIEHDAEKEMFAITGLTELHRRAIDYYIKSPTVPLG